MAVTPVPGYFLISVLFARVLVASLTHGVYIYSGEGSKEKMIQLEKVGIGHKTTGTPNGRPTTKLVLPGTYTKNSRFHMKRGGWGRQKTNDAPNISLQAHPFWNKWSCLNVNFNPSYFLYFGYERGAPDFRL